MEVNIRNAALTDVPGILRIFNEAIRHTTAVYDDRPRSLEMQKAWFEKKRSDFMPVIVAVNEGEVVGFGTYGIFRPLDGYRYSVEHSVYVLKEFRGKGIGKMLLTELISLAQKEGYHTIVAGIDTENTASIAFHEAFGFKEVGRLQEVGYKFERWLDLIFMQLMLQKESAKKES